MLCFLKPFVQIYIRKNVQNDAMSILFSEWQQHHTPKNNLLSWRKQTTSRRLSPGMVQAIKANKRKENFHINLILLRIPSEYICVPSIICIFKLMMTMWAFIYCDMRAAFLHSSFNRWEYLGENCSICLVYIIRWSSLIIFKLADQPRNELDLFHIGVIFFLQPVGFSFCTGWEEK